jgi:hypothetical protein
VVVVSRAVVLAQMLITIMISWRHFHECPAAGAASDVASILWMATAFTDIVLSSLWLEGMHALPRPLKPSVTSFVVRDVALECRDQMCAICLDELSPGCLAGRLPCNHVFHESCCRTWLEIGHRQARCPMRCEVAPSSPNGGSPSGSGPVTNDRATDLESHGGPLEVVPPASWRAEVQSTSHAAISVAEAV